MVPVYAGNVSLLSACALKAAAMRPARLAEGGWIVECKLLKTHAARDMVVAVWIVIHFHVN